MALAYSQKSQCGFIVQKGGGGQKKMMNGEDIFSFPLLLLPTKQKGLFEFSSEVNGYMQDIIQCINLL